MAFSPEKSLLETGTLHSGYTNKVYADKTRERIYYADLPKLLGKIREHAVAYVPTLSMMVNVSKR